MKLPSLYPRKQSVPPFIVGYMGYSTPAAVVVDGLIHIYHDVFAFQTDNSTAQVALHHVVATDSSAWTIDIPFVTPKLCFGYKNGLSIVLG